VVFDSLRLPGNIILSKDEDFIDIATRLGPPPQILWLRVGNCSNHQLREFLKVGLPLAVEALGRGDPVVELRRKRD
jgi:predicted nuclease of predicted toxin-antitoxin system